MSLQGFLNHPVQNALSFSPASSCNLLEHAPAGPTGIPKLCVSACL